MKAYFLSLKSLSKTTSLPLCIEINQKQEYKLLILSKLLVLENPYIILQIWVRKGIGDESVEICEIAL